MCSPQKKSVRMQSFMACMGELIVNSHLNRPPMCGGLGGLVEATGERRVRVGENKQTTSWLLPKNGMVLGEEVLSGWRLGGPRQSSECCLTPFLGLHGGPRVTGHPRQGQL